VNAREALRDIYERHAQLTPAIVVEGARPEDAPLHDQFEWDDQVAGERYRLVQAGDMIRKYKITYAHDKDGSPRTIREWVSVSRPDQSRSYIPTGEAVMDPFTKEALKRECLREARAFKIKYSALDEYAVIVAGMADTG
jgi:hypothetical protein